MAKQSLSDRVFALLDDERVEVRCAAAVVLGAAGKGDAAVERALARKLGDESPLMRRFALEALEAVGARKLGAELIPLLGSSDEDTRNRALRLLAAISIWLAGRHAVPRLRAAAGIVVEGNTHN